MYPVFMAQWMKDKRKPLIIICFIALSILATVIFGNSGPYTQANVAIFSSGPSAEENENKWAALLNDSSAIEFVITDEQQARQDVAEGRSNVAIYVMESDYRLVTSSDILINIELIEQQVHQVFTREAQLEAAADKENTDKLRNGIKSYMENPPFKVQTQSLNGGGIPNFNMGMQLLFGFTLFIAMFTIGFKVNGITADKVNGIWNRLILSPVSKTNMYVGHLFYSFCVGFIQMLIVFLVFEVVMDYELGHFPMILVIAAVYTLSIVSLAMLFAAIAKTPEKFNMIYPSTVPMIPIISGVYFPPGVISNPVLVFIGDLFPLGHAVNALMDVSLFDAGWSDIALPISFMLLIGVACMGIGINLVERKV